MTDQSGNPFDAIGFEPSAASSGGEGLDANGSRELTVHRGAPAAVPDPSAATGSPTAPAAASAPSPAANPFDKIGFEQDAPAAPSASPATQPGILANAPDDTFWSGVAKNAGSTAIKGLSHAPGFVGDIAGFADALTEIPEYIESKVTGQPFADVVAKRNALGAKSQAASDAFDKSLLGFSPDPRHYFPAGSDISGFIADHATGAYQPQTALGRYGSAAGEAVLGGFGPGGGNMLKGVVQHALPNAAAGVGSQIVGEKTNDPLLASLAGIGASGVAGVMKGAPQRKAASLLAGAADDPSGALSTINAGNPDALPNVPQTTAEATGDPGLYRLQNQVAENNPNAFTDRRVQQNRGRLAALDSLTPNADPQDVARFFSNHFDDISDRTQAIVDGHLADARSQADALQGQGLTTDAYGTILRNNLTDAESARTDAEGKLWDAVDPENKLTNDLTGVKQASADIYGAMPAADRAFMSPAESAFSGLVDGYKDVEPFRQVAALKSNLASAMRQELRENGNTPAYARMSRLMAPVQQAISGTVARRAAADNAAVAAEQMAPENTLESALLRSSSQFAADRTAGGSFGESPELAATGTETRLPDSAGTRGQDDGQSRRASGNQSLPGAVSRDPAQGGPASGVAPAYYPGGVLGVRHELAEHGSLITSHDADFRPRADYPQNLQPRARDSAGARDQVNGMAARLQPERLGPSPEANSGAPIVGPDHVVESGNGRTMAIGKAYDAGRGNAYRQHLESLGHDTSGFEKPVLIGRRVTPMTPDEREFFTHSANGATALRMGSAEQAAADAKHFTPAMLDSMAGPNIAASTNRSFVGAFMSKLPAAERGALVDQGGNLSQAGVRRIQAAMAANAYRDHGVIARAFDAADSNIKGIAGALIDASGPWAKMRAAASRGEISPEHDVTPELMQAMKLVMRARDEGRPIGEVLRQGDLFNSETSRLVAGMLTRDGEKPASRPQIEAALRSYAEEATKNAGGPRLFGEAAPVDEVLRASQARADRETGSQPLAPVFADVPPAPTANMDADAEARYQAANTATKERARIFGVKPIADVLAEKGGRGNFKLPDSAVPNKLFVKGPGGAEVVNAYREAVNDDPAAMATLRDHAVDSMRRDVMSSDGTLPDAKLEKWRKDHEDALRAFPELASQFRDAGAAAKAFDDAAAQRKQLIRSYEKSAFGQLMNATHPEEVQHIVGSLLKNPANVSVLRRLTSAAAADPMALAGFRRAVMDHIVSKYVSDIETMSGPQRTIRAKAFRDFVVSSRPGLEAILDGPSASMLNRIAHSLPHAASSLETLSQAKRADLSRYLKAATRPHETLSDRIFKIGVIAHELGEGVNEVFGGEHGGVVTAALAAAGILGKKTMTAIRATGTRKVGDLITDAVLDPESYAALVKKAPMQPDAGNEVTLASRLRKASMFAPDAMAGIARHIVTRAPRQADHDRDQRRHSKPQQRAAGGRVEPTDAQKEAGNYSKDHIRAWGMNIAIENCKGTERRGTGKDGKAWSVKMPAHYGYIKGTEGADGDHVDCYLGPGMMARDAYIIDQNDLGTGKFDEHKIMLGFKSPEDALQTYARGFSDGKGLDRAARITRIPSKDVFAWAKSDAAKKPMPTATPARRARGGLVGGGGGPFGVPTFGQTLAPTKKAMSRGLGFSTGGTVPDLPEWASPPGAVERALRMIDERRRAG